MAVINLADYQYTLSLDSSKYDSSMTNAAAQADLMKDKLSGVGSFMQTALVGGLVAAGAAIGATIVKSVQSADELKKAMNGFRAETGITTETFGDFEQSLKNIYANNYGEDFEDIADAMATVSKNASMIDASNIEAVTTNALALRDTFEFDIQDSMNSVNMLMEQFGITSDEAFNLIAQGAQNGLNKNGDLLDTINEYSVQFAQLGFSSDEMFNALANGAYSGTFSVDKLGDAVKEFGIRVKDGTANDAFAKLGLDVEGTTQAFASGGDAAKEAMGQVTEALFSMDDPVQQNLLGVSMFGTQWEDLGVEGVKALMDLSGEMDKTYDSMGQIKEIKYDSFGEAISGIGRQLETGIMLPLGEKILPMLNSFGNWLNTQLPGAIAVCNNAFSTISAFIQPVIDIIGTVISSFTDADSNSNTSFTSIRDTIMSVITAIQGALGAFVTLFNTIWDKWGADIVAFAQKYLGDVMNNFTNVFAYIQSIIQTVTALLSGDWKGFLDGIQNIAQTGLELVKGLFKTAFDLIGGIVGAGINLVKTVLSTAFTAIINLASSVLDSIGSGISTAFNNVISFMSRLPGTFAEILGNAVSKVAEWGGNLISKGTEAANSLVNAIKIKIEELPGKMADIGKNLVKGIWNGIDDTTSWIISKIKGFGTSVLNGIKNIFGIHSPSTLMRDEVGKFLAEGIGVGFEDEIGGVNKQIQDSINTDFDISPNLINSASLMNPSVVYAQNAQAKQTKESKALTIQNNYDSFIRVDGNIDKDFTKLFKKAVEEARELSAKDLYDSARSILGSR